MTRIFIHVEALFSTANRPYRLSACDADRSRVFEANILWPGVEPFQDELSRVCPEGKWIGTTDGANVGCYGVKGMVVELFNLWLDGCPGGAEYWTKSLQQSWRELNALGLHILPVCDLSTFVRMSGLDFDLESLVAKREAIERAGATSPRTGAYEQAMLFNNVRRKTSK